MWNKAYLTAFLISVFAALFSTPIVRMIARKFDFLDYPDERKNHSSPVPVLGGVAVYIAFLAGVFSASYYSNAVKVILSGGLLLLVMGIIDDKKKIPATVKVLTIAALAIALSRFGIIIKLSHFYILNLAVSVFWILFITSAVNAIDNMDGLACGICGIAATFFFIAAFRTHHGLFAIISAALCGATFGFLPYNFKPAKIFLGNGGSFFLGFTLAAIAIMGEWSDYSLISFTIPTLILAIPIFDLSFVVLWRFKKGITRSFKDAILYSARDHLSHRLERLGLTQRRVVTILYLLSIGVGISATIALPVDSFFEEGLILFQAFVMLSILIIAINIGRRDLGKL